MSTRYEGQRFDLMIALHAWRSRKAIAEFDRQWPQAPLFIALTGTDLYKFIHSHPEETLRSIELADQLVALHELAHEALPLAARSKVHVIHQSAEPPSCSWAPSKRYFDVCVVGHLRDEKDPLRAAVAVRTLDSSSRIRVLHYGRAHHRGWADRAEEEMARNRRYRWLGDMPHWQIRRAYSRCRLVVLSSKMEGGANVISEAVVAGLPVVASAIPGSIGLLGKNYAGYYPVGDTAALRELLQRTETDARFLEGLRRQCKARSRLFEPERERRAWKRLLAGLG